MFMLLGLQQLRMNTGGGTWSLEFLHRRVTILLLSQSPIVPHNRDVTEARVSSSRTRRSERTVHFLYDGTIEINTAEDAVELLEFTRRFMMDIMEHAVVEHIVLNYIDTSNCWHILELVDRGEDARKPLG